jgi:hypothetical protein
MRRVLRRIGARTGISFGLIVVIAAVLVVARLVADGRDPRMFPRPAETTPAVAATEGDDGPVEEEPDSPIDDSAVLDSATAFVAAWLERTRPAEQWLDGLRPHATDGLIDRLTGVDPLSVPASATPGTPRIRSRSAAYVEVLIPLGTGDTLLLGLVSLDDRWLVATLDQEVSVSLGPARPRDHARPVNRVVWARNSI